MSGTGKKPRGRRAACAAGLVFAAALTFANSQEPGSAAAPAFETRSLEGWTVYVNRSALAGEPACMEKTLEHLEQQLFQVARAVPAPALKKLQAIPIWVEYETKTACMAYHPARAWLVAHGYSPPEVPSVVELGGARNFLTWTLQQPWMVLHELAHGYNHLCLSGDGSYHHSAIEEAYQRALKSGSYESVLHIGGGRGRHYAMTNMMEYFAEASEAYFGTNDIYPFVRAELREVDPHGCRLLEKLWDVPKRNGADGQGSPWYALRYRGCLTGVGHGAQPDRAGSRRRACTPTEAYAGLAVEGWTVRLSPELREKEALAREVIELLTHRLHLINRTVPGPALERLKEAHLWLELGGREVPYAAYHTSASWLEAHGMNPDKAGSVEIGDVEKFLAWTDLQPGLVLHLLAHAFHDRVLGFDDRYIRAAHRKAVDGGALSAVLRFDGKRDRHFGLTDEKEFFAEATEAYFGTNDYYPFVRSELEEVDPKVYRLLGKLWEAMERRP